MRFALCLLPMMLFAQPAPYRPTADERSAIERRADELEAALRPLRANTADNLLVDAEVYLKAARWILRYGEFYTKAYVAQTLTVLDTGLARARMLASGAPAWTKQTGSFCRAYRSRVDGSVQPYALTVPENYDGSTPQWLEVILHGRGTTLNEVSFLYAHDRAKPAPADHQFIKLDVFGRGNNAYRWAGETDVFEAIESVRKRYRIDPNRIALRGFSMGGAGAWHLGLHYPDLWAVVESGAGFVETKDYAKLTSVPPYVHIYDAADYARNAVNVPMVGYAGEIDPQLRSSVLIRETLQKEGVDVAGPDSRLLFLVGPQTAHKWHPESKQQSDAFVLRHQSAGVLDRGKLSFVTYTERYNHAFRVTIDQLERQYERAQVDAEIDGVDYKVATRNVARITLTGEPPLTRFRIDGQAFPIEPSATFERSGGAWKRVRGARGVPLFGKRRGLQGPIDDAFMESFLCVEPAAGGSEVDRFARGRYDRLAAEFPKWMRGDIRTKPAAALTAADQRAHHVVLFGTPASNPRIAAALSKTPVRWTSKQIRVGSRSFDAATHMLSMIHPNPSAPERYLVINGGHTFHEADFKGTNALLFPRVGDWAVTDVRTGAVAAEGVFDRNWQLR
jgi:predicted esterase